SAVFNVLKCAGKSSSSSPAIKRFPVESVKLVISRISKASSLVANGSARIMRGGSAAGGGAVLATGCWPEQACSRKSAAATASKGQQCRGAKEVERMVRGDLFIFAAKLADAKHGPKFVYPRRTCHPPIHRSITTAAGSTPPCCSPRWAWR